MGQAESVPRDRKAEEIERRAIALERAFGLDAPTQDLARKLEDALRGARTPPDGRGPGALQLLSATDERALENHIRRFGLGGVRAFKSNEGDRIFQIQTETLPRHINHVYLILAHDLAGHERRILWDVGSGIGNSRRDIQSGFALIRKHFDAPQAQAETLTDIVISHAHIDHFGDAAFFQRNAPGATLALHRLDAQILENFEERVVLSSKRVGVFLRRAGVPDNIRDELVTVYESAKTLFENVKVDRHLEHRDTIAGRFNLIHTVGHCPGHVCMQVADHMLVGDQVLSPITPNISPQSITALTGLEHYLGSLKKLRDVETARCLPAHCDVIDDLSRRVDQIIEHHHERLEKVADLCRTPKTITEVSDGLFGPKEGYERLLAILEAGSHVEYLNERNLVRITNLSQISEEREPPIIFKTY